MFSGHDDILRLLAQQHGWLTPDRVEAIAQADKSQTSFAEQLLATGIGRDCLLRAISRYLGFDFLEEVPTRLDGEILGVIDGQLARTCRVVPLRIEDGTPLLALVDPLDAASIDVVRFAHGANLRFAVADPAPVHWLLEKHFGIEAPGERRRAGDFAIDRETASTPAPAPAHRESGLVVDFVDFLLAKAVRESASDVHLEPYENEFRVRLRIDGALRELAPPRAEWAAPVISRLKVLAGLDVAERRVPQDGRIAFDVDARPVEFRVSTLPAQHGESLVLRVLDQSSAQKDLAALGLPPAIERTLRAAIAKPSGIVIVTGPTGSGKTTTLYGCLRELNDPQAKLLTVEDPVEYEIDGVMQSSVNPAADFDFAAALKSFLRHDPDIVMVGEIRDPGTARIAMQAALTGHLVLTTLHTNDAAGAIARLADLGIEPFLIASTLELVVAQRLVRRRCPHCAANGCGACHGGYSGRMPLFEVLAMTDSLRDAIVAGAPLSTLRQLALEGGTVPLRAAGAAAVRLGLTTHEEVLRHTG